ncbi:hypothetical protein CLROS_021330 [Clostridium felsineum]|uniref:Uncharacterized protein n=1 Tax=Clostridium felsineum TaxID=36839 RepID=A0A1S8L4A2_9CLOT|nr:hypothetical protein CLROS_021330 [Clostridium felsineum]URZ11832.1 hypothetical protein CROST_025490 [Clostridium felsineum]
MKNLRRVLLSAMVLGVAVLPFITKMIIDTPW